MSVPVPRMATEIRKHALFAEVVITAPDGRTLTTTLDRDVKASDLKVENYKRQLAHLPKVRP